MASEKPADAKPADAKPADSEPPAESKPEPPAETEVTAAKPPEHNAVFEGDDVNAWRKWPAPQVAFLITGQQHGYIEPCGCTGLENQKGGMARRHTLIQQIAEKGWNLIPVDSGNQARRSGPQAVIKFQTAIDALADMGYRVVGFGPDDLRLGVEHLLSAVLNERGDVKFISSNIVLYDPSQLASFRLIEAGGRKIGITTAIDPKTASETYSEITINDPVAGLQKATAEMDAAGVNYRVLLWYGNEDSATELLSKLPQWDLIVLGDDEHEPTYQPERLPGSKALVIRVGHKGMYACMFGLFDDAQKPVRYARIPLTHEFSDSPEMMAKLASYQKQLEALGWDGLGIRPVSHPSGRKFVGTESCAECHTKAFAVFEKTPHAHATESLVNPPNTRSEIPRHFDPECISCHATGWNAQQYYPYEGGYLSLTTTAPMVGNGCENCHGPGSEHVAAENGDIQVDDARLAAIRASMRLPLAKAREKCLECHDIDNSPDFHKEGAFEEYWQQVEHKGLD